MRPGIGARLGRGLLAALAAAGSTTAALRGLRAGSWLPGGTARWNRTNHAGDPVTLLEGPAASAGLLAGISLAPGLPARTRTAALTAVAGAAAIGAWDDLAETGSSKGLRGHLGALRHGQVTTGTLKIGGLVLAGVAASALAGPGGARASEGSRVGRACDLAVGAGVVAGAANVVNLFDLRPGRSLKVVLLSAPVALGGAGAGLAAATCGAAAAALPDDLGERSMLGDSGANAFGAALGCLVLVGCGRRGRIAALTAVSALTLASEKVSFSKVIAATPVLRELDALGRRPR